MKDNNRIIANCVSQTVFELNEFGYFAADLFNVWFDDLPIFTDIFYFQLKCKLLQYYTEEEVKDITLYFRESYKEERSKLKID